MAIAFFATKKTLQKSRYRTVVLYRASFSPLLAIALRFGGVAIAGRGLRAIASTNLWNLPTMRVCPTCRQPSLSWRNAIAGINFQGSVLALTFLPLPALGRLALTLLGWVGLACFPVAWRGWGAIAGWVAIIGFSLVRVLNSGYIVQYEIVDHLAHVPALSRTNGFEFIP